MTLSVDIRHQLGDFTLEIAFASGGRLTALFGPSGSGKTSLVNIVAGLVRPQHGRISIDGRTLVDTERGVFVPKHRRIKRLYRRRPPGGRRICVDEFGPLNLLPRAGCCLTGRGKQVERHRATYSRKGGVRHWLAAYDLESDKLLGQFYARKTWEQFLDFADRRLKR